LLGLTLTGGDRNPSSRAPSMPRHAVIGVPTLLLLSVVMLLPLSVSALARASAGSLSASQRNQLLSLASNLISTNPSLASDIAHGRVSPDTRNVRSVADLHRTLTSPDASPSSSNLRLRGGFSPSPSSPSLLSRRTPTSSMKAAKPGVLAGLSLKGLHLRGGRNTQVLGGLRGMAGAPDVVTDGEMATQYDPSAVEKPIYEWWEKAGYFKPTEYEEGEKGSYVLPMPPPNVTGGLHMGHAMFVALQDIMARFHRMRGRPTLYLPGTDHAGIATQLLVERSLNEEGTTRFEIGREKFLERVWEWKEEKGGYITKQMRRLGTSADWSRERFTMDDGLSRATAEAFVQLHDKGLVYRGDYMVNWSPNLQTAVSDLEVEYSEEEGKLYYFKYPIKGSDEYLSVATTRPETILGDTAVCVHPEDERYKHLVGKTVVVPTQDREIPIIADDYVDMEFGTGCLKITPGHDPNDYEIGKRHDLKNINIMNRDATLNNFCGKYEGMDRFEARKQLWSDLEEMGIAIEAKPHTQRVPRSQRGGEVIEPLVSTQWFVKTRGMADRGVEAVKSGELKIIPERFEKTWFNWLDNIHDWCVSRQLWWGHRIPVWHVDGSGDYPVSTKYVVAATEEEAYTKAKKEHGEDVKLTQDPDVLDTWFSSGLWPFSVMGWPDKGDASSDYARFYAHRGSSCLETGYDILFFWVARMVMLGGELTGQMPFDTVYMHGLVRDAKGKKMSKTTGNVIDPLDTIDEYGTDALRYTLSTGITPGLDVPLDMKKVEYNRNFANKLWNSARFVLGNLEGISKDEWDALAVTGPMSEEEMASLPVPEQYIVSQCHELVNEVTAQLEEYTLGQAGEQVQTFLWDEFADWYLEISKVRLFAAQKSDDPEVQAAAARARRVLVYVLDTSFRLLHPFMPYVTEAIWQRCPHKGDALMTARWPLKAGEVLPSGGDAVREFKAFQALVRKVRSRPDALVPFRNCFRYRKNIRKNERINKRYIQKRQDGVTRECVETTPPNLPKRQEFPRSRYAPKHGCARTPGPL